RHQMPATGALSATAKLGPALFARLTPRGDYLQNKLTGLKTVLSAGVVGLSLFTIALVLLLVRRYITNPIARLATQVTEVVSGERTEITAASEAGEIGRLSANMKRLHDSSVRSYDLVRAASWSDTLTGVSN